LDSRNAAALKTKIEQGFEVNTRSQDGHNTMHCAAATKDIELAKLASSKGVNADATNRDGVTPLHLAAQSGSYEIVVLLIGNGADVMPRRI
jgi:ankyrin repeat protein